MTALALGEIELFAFCEPAHLAELAPFFVSKTYLGGETILEQGGVVGGLYLLVSGQVEVRTRAWAAPLATLEAGACLGEMALAEGDSAASASVICSSVVAEFLFCSRVRFAAFLAERPDFAASFHRSAARTLSRKLRQTNERVSAQIQGAIARLRGNAPLLDVVALARDQVDRTGSSMLSHFARLLPLIDEVLARDPIAGKKLAVAKAQAQEQVFRDAQHFDFIAQELDLIAQILANVLRVLGGQAEEPLRGDREIVAKTQATIKVE